MIGVRNGMVELGTVGLAQDGMWRRRIVVFRMTGAEAGGHLVVTALTISFRERDHAAPS